MNQNRRRLSNRVVITNHTNRANNNKNLGSLADWVGIGISAVIGIFTLLLFNQTKTATEAAVRADSISIEALKLSKRQFDSAIESGKSSQTQFESTFENQKRLVDAQIDLVDETKKQTSATTISFLKFKDFEFYRDTINPISATFKRLNLGNQPIRITKGWAECDTFSSVNLTNPEIFLKKRYNFKKEIQYNIILGKDNIYDDGNRNDDYQTVKSDIIISKKYYDKIINRTKFILLYGVINYTNIVTHKTYQYKFVFEDNVDYIDNNQGVLYENTDEIK